MAYSILPFEALCKKAAMCAAYAAKKSGFSRAFGVEDLRDRAIEQLAVGGKNILGVGIAMSDLCIKIGCWRRGVIGIMEFRAAVFPHGLAERSEIGERRNHPRTGLWCFVVRVRDLVGSLEEAPRETQVAAKSFVPTNAFLFVERLLDQQLCGA